VRRAAFLRPMSLLVVVIGATFFALSLVWWAIPLTLATYAALVFLAARDPLSQDYILTERGARRRVRSTAPENGALSPDRRVRWLPRGETRRKVEEALELHRRTIVAIEESGEVAQAVLEDAIPKLHGISERLVDVAERREKVSEAIQDLETHASGHANTPHREGQDTYLADLENELRVADTEISQTIEKLSTLRARVVRVSVESGGAAQDAAAKLNTDLDEMNLRLDALRSTMSSPEGLS
jgi:N-methylhydantoinase B/oxoprolinase/acetone carboxylase alpha subunit